MFNSDEVYVVIIVKQNLMSCQANSLAINKDKKKVAEYTICPLYFCQNSKGNLKYVIRRFLLVIRGPNIHQTMQLVAQICVVKLD